MRFHSAVSGQLDVIFRLVGLVRMAVGKWHIHGEAKSIPSTLALTKITPDLYGISNFNALYVQLERCNKYNQFSQAKAAHYCILRHYVKSQVVLPRQRSTEVTTFARLTPGLKQPATIDRRAPLCNLHSRAASATRMEAHRPPGRHRRLLRPSRLWYRYPLQG